MKEEGRRKKEEGRRRFIYGDTGPKFKTDYLMMPEY
jgi:hypothetical protein